MKKQKKISFLFDMFGAAALVIAIIIFGFDDNMAVQSGKIAKAANLGTETIDVKSFLQGPLPSDTSQTSGSSQQADQFVPPPQILHCSLLTGNRLILDTMIPMRIDCQLSADSVTIVKIVKGTYDPSQDQDGTKGTVVKYLQYRVKYTGINTQAIPLYFVWNGLDQYDNPVEDGDYGFVVIAYKIGWATPAISYKKFTVQQTTPVPTQQTQVTTQQNPAAGVSSNTQQNPPQSTPATTQVVANPPVETKPLDSQCPGIKYPTDISNHRAEDLIRSAVDQCIIKDFTDGKIFPDRAITRFDALKQIMLAAGVQPKVGC